MLWEQPVHYASLSDVGLRRENNEDSHVVRIQRDHESFESHGHLFVVADGMGGHAVGELASKLAVETVPLAFYKSHGEPTTTLREAVEEANRVIHDRGSANHDFRRMGTTCSALLLGPSGALIAHVGDSRVYRVRDHRIDQLTFDHSLQWELNRQMGRSVADVGGREPRNVITRSLGPESTVDVDVEGPFPVTPGDRFVLCSDGLCNLVHDEEIGATVQYLSPTEACRLLVNLALLRGGTDNVTVIVVEVNASPSSNPEETHPALPVYAQRQTAGWDVLGWGLATVLLVGGILCGLVAEQWNLGSVLGVIGVAILFATIALRMRRRVGTELPLPPDAVDTVIWRPHASASAQLTRRFVEGLGTLDDELARTAREEEWTIDWTEQSAASEEARDAYRDRKFPTAFAARARSLSHLVRGIVDRRNHLQREARWGRSTTADSSEPA